MKGKGTGGPCVLGAGVRAAQDQAGALPTPFLVAGDGRGGKREGSGRPRKVHDGGETGSQRRARVRRWKSQIVVHPNHNADGIIEAAELARIEDAPLSPLTEFKKSVDARQARTRDPCRAQRKF